MPNGNPDSEKEKIDTEQKIEDDPIEPIDEEGIEVEPDELTE